MRKRLYTKLPVRFPALSRIGASSLRTVDALCAAGILRYSEDSKEAHERPLLDLVTNSEWYGLKNVASPAPESFLHSVWPWFVEVASLLAHSTGASPRHRTDWQLEFDSLPPSDIRHAIRVAVAGFAGTSPAAFLEFVRRNKASDLMPVHILLCSGLRRLVASAPAEALTYLLRDPRRLAIGPHSDVHSKTRNLISDLASHLTRGQVLRRTDRRDWLGPPQAPDGRWQRPGVSSVRRVRVSGAASGPRAH